MEEGLGASCGKIQRTECYFYILCIDINFYAMLTLAVIRKNVPKLFQR